MSRDPLASSNNDAESALSDDELDVVVGGRAVMCPLHPEEQLGHMVYDGPTTTSGRRCPGR
jgi:hypothetical protein